MQYLKAVVLCVSEQSHVRMLDWLEEQEKNLWGEKYKIKVCKFELVVRTAYNGQSELALRVALCVF